MSDPHVIHVKLSDTAGEFLAAALDLIEAVQTADPALVTDEILAALGRLEAVIDARRGEL